MANNICFPRHIVAEAERNGECALAIGFAGTIRTEMFAVMPERDARLLWLMALNLDGKRTPAQALAVAESELADGVKAAARTA